VANDLRARILGLNIPCKKAISISFAQYIGSFTATDALPVAVYKCRVAGKQTVISPLRDRHTSLVHQGNYSNADKFWAWLQVFA
jgi:hypothetical protein